MEIRRLFTIISSTSRMKAFGKPIQSTGIDFEGFISLNQSPFFTGMSFLKPDSLYGWV